MGKKSLPPQKNIAKSRSSISSDYFETSDSVDTETFTFVNALHPHNNAGNIVRIEKTQTSDLDIPGIWQMASKNTTDIADLCTIKDENAEVFVTLNRFYGYSRKGSKCSAIEGMYIDLDGHNFTCDQLQSALEKTEQRLNIAWNRGEILPPTCITLTGRGIGLFYVLNKPIAAQSNKTKKLIRYYKWIYAMLVRAYQVLLTDDGYLTVDPVVMDEARVVRLPGTYNAAAEKTCRLCNVRVNDEGNPILYTLNNLKDGCNLEKYTNKKRKVCGNSAFKFPGNSDWNRGLQTHRINWLFKAVKIKQNQCDEGYRDQALHFLYNAAVQVMDYNDAESLIREINNSFSKPLKEREVLSIVNTIRSNGVYRYTTQKMIQRMQLSYDEAEQCGCRISARDLERKEKRQKKQERNEMIISMRRNHPEFSRQDILSELHRRGFQCSMRTLDRVILKSGLNYYQVKCKEKTRNNECRMDVAPKTAKNDTVCYFSLKGDTSYKSSVKYANSFISSLYDMYGNDAGCLKMLDTFVETLENAEKTIQEKAYKELAYIAHEYRNKVEYQLIRVVFSDLNTLYQGLQSGVINATFCGKKIPCHYLNSTRYPDTFEYIWEENSHKQVGKDAKKKSDGIVERKCTPNQKKAIYFYERYEYFTDFVKEEPRAGAVMNQVYLALMEFVEEPGYNMLRNGIINFLSLTKTQWKFLLEKMSEILTPDMGAREVLDVFEQVTCRHFRLTSLKYFEGRKKKHRLTDKQRLAAERRRNMKAMWDTLYFIKDNESEAADFCAAFLSVYRDVKEAKDEVSRMIKAEFNALLPQDIRYLADSVRGKKFEKEKIKEYILTEVKGIGERRRVSQGSSMA